MENSGNQNSGSNINIDPVRTPVLYADAINIKSSETGMVLDVMQQVGPTNQFVVVARIGLSREHGKLLNENLDASLRSQGDRATKNIN